jgi:hypothetical protein
VSAEQPRDWRGTPIVPGATVIYGASIYSHSIEMVEATVAVDRPMVTPSGAIRLDVVRRARDPQGRWARTPRVCVGPLGLTVVKSLPEYREVTPVGAVEGPTL